jgi:putative sigma-54 modulation protein
MDVRVRGKNVRVPQDVSERATYKLSKLSRLASDITDVEVDFSKVRNPREPLPQVCEVTIHLKRGVVKAHASAAEPMTALDRVVDKAEHQVSKLKSKRIGRSHARTHGAGRMPASLDEPDTALEAASPAGQDGGSAAPAVVRRKEVDAKPMSIDEAALQLEMLDHAFFLFTDAASGQAAVLYRRRDGNLGLIRSTG